MNNNNAINREVKPEPVPNSSATPPAFANGKSDQNINQNSITTKTKTKTTKNHPFGWFLDNSAPCYFPAMQYPRRCWA